VPIHWLIDVGYNQTKELKPLNTLGKLEQQLLAGEISESEYKEKKAVYVETLLELYINDIISKEELYKRINE
jgi:hypothetical protein